MKKLFVLLLLAFLYEHVQAQMLEVKRRNSVLTERTQEIAKESSEKGLDTTNTEEPDATNQDTNLKGLGNFTFNGRKVIPNIQIIADRVSRPSNEASSRFYSKIELFSGVEPPSSEQAEYKSNFFIPEFSTYGLNTTIAWCRKKGYENKNNGESEHEDNDEYNDNNSYDKAFVGFVLSTSILEKSFCADR